LSARPAPASSRWQRGLRVVIADGQQLFLDGLRALLEENGVEVVAVASDGFGAVESAITCDPDVVLVDLDLAVASGMDAVRHLAALATRSRVVVLTPAGAEDDVLDAIVAGGVGHLSRDAPIDAMVEGLECVAAGECLIAPPVIARLLERIHIWGAESLGDEGGETSLTGRELEVLRLLADGADNQGIAARLLISPQTAKKHVSSILAKLRIENRVQAAVYAVRHGIV
jgi:DNA-binding NarL/FixJ family response regulator